MKLKQKLIPGILGGVGPSATIDFLKLLVALTPATKDQEHLIARVSFYPHPGKPKNFLDENPSPVPTFIKEAQALLRAGVDFFAITSNATHYFLPEITKNVDAPFVNMITETGRIIEKDGYKKVGLLSNAGVAKADIYQSALKPLGIKVVVPSKDGVIKEMEAIYGKKGIKAGIQYEKSKQNKNFFKDVINELQDKGVEAIIMGCTEIPLCLDFEDSDIPLINPTKILAQAVVNKALGISGY